MRELKININPSQLKSIPLIECRSCKGTEFIKVLNLKKVPSIMSGTSLPLVIELPLYQCVDCEFIYDPVK